MHHRRALGPIHHNQLEELPGAVGAKNQVASRIFVDLLHDQCVAQDMLEILRSDAMAEC